MAQKKPIVWTLHDEWAITPHCAYTLEGSTMAHDLFTCPSLSTQPRLLFDTTARLAQRRTALYKRTHFHLVTPCQWLADRVRKTPLGTHDLRVIYNGVDTTTFHPADQKVARQELGLPLDKKIVLFLATAGAANTWKGWTYTEAALEAFTHNPDVLFLNVGGLSPETTVTPQVIYRPHESNPALVARYYQAADVLLSTSIAENFPLVILEAMSCGLPVVSFEVGGVAEAISHTRSGYLAKYRDESAVVTGLTWALSLSDQERADVAACARAKVQSSFSLEQMTDAYLSLYQSLITKKPS
jgi:glycosyltransferase involved in cell wall biosynthesis